MSKNLITLSNIINYLSIKNRTTEQFQTVIDDIYKSCTFPSDASIIKEFIEEINNTLVSDHSTQSITTKLYCMGDFNQGAYAFGIKVYVSNMSAPFITISLNRADSFENVYVLNLLEQLVQTKTNLARLDESLNNELFSKNPCNDVVTEFLKMLVSCISSLGVIEFKREDLGGFEFISKFYDGKTHCIISSPCFEDNYDDTLKTYEANYPGQLPSSLTVH